MSDPVKILLVEHSPADIELILDELESAEINFISAIVQFEHEYITAIKDFIPDIILSDYTLPSFNGPEAFKIRAEMAPGTPFIFVSGSIGEERSIEYIRTGLTDYVLKDKLFTIGVKVKRALKEVKEQKEKSRAEKDLALSESLLARAQQVAHLGSWELNFDDNELRLSAEGARIFGFPPEQNRLSFEAWSALVDPDDLSEVLQTIEASRKSLKDTSYHHRIILKDGAVRHIYAESKFEFDVTGKAVGVYGTMQDITERKKAEAAIKKAYEERNTVLERIDDGFFATDKRSIVTYWNKRAEILLDIKKEDVVGKNLHDVFASTASTAFYDHYQKAISENSTVRFEEFSKRTGKWFAVSAFGSDNGLSVYFKDITEQKISENKLRESELRYRSLIEQATDAICITDASMKFIDINLYACEMFGYTLEEALQLNLTDILFLEDLADNPLKVNELKLGKTIRNERRLKRKNGTAVDMEVSTKIIEDGMLIMFGHDITERKKAEQLISESEKKYRQIVETAQEGIWLIDENNTTTFVNKKMCELLEYTEAEMVGRTNLSFKDEAGQEKALLQIETRKNGQKEIHESTFITRSGKEIWVYISTNPIFREDGSYAGALAMITDITQKKKEEQEMTWLINNTEESFILLNTDLDIISFNSQFHRLYLKYLEIDVVKGDCILNYALPGRREALKKLYKGVLEGTEAASEINIERPGKEDKNFALKYKPAKDEQEKVIGVFVSAIDVTEKKKSEQQLITQEKRYRALVENGADGVIILSPVGKLQYISPAVEKILGYTEEEMLQLDIFSLAHPGDVTAIRKVWERVLASPGVTVPGHTNRMLHKDGSWRWLEATITNLLHDDALNGIVDNFRDVTEKKELENLLNKTNSLARIGSWEMDMIKSTVYWSDITKEIHETAQDFMPDLKTAINFYKEGESRELITKSMQEAVDNAVPFDAEVQLITAKGNEKWVRTIGDAEFANGKCIKINGSLQDITDRKQDELQLNELNEDIKKHAKELAISNAELEQFAFVASHDLQEPLRMITSFLSRLEKKYGDVIDAKGKQYIDFAVDGAKRMRQIILDLLEFSRVGNTENSEEDIDLNELIDEIQILLRKKIKEKNACLIIDHLPQIHACRAPMRQIFQNLIDNALKYAWENIPSEIHITVEELPMHWQFAISDNGIGIAEEYFDKIFIIFQRLHNKDEFSGTGMGLAVTKKIIETLGGRIWVESKERKGSTFYFTIKK
jgi:PAS domain S-box-containing protein